MSTIGDSILPMTPGGGGAHLHEVHVVDPLEPRRQQENDRTVPGPAAPSRPPPILPNPIAVIAESASRESCVIRISPPNCDAIILRVGVPLPDSALRSLFPGEQFSIGECVGIRRSPTDAATLTVVKKIGLSTLGYAGPEPIDLQQASIPCFWKLKRPFLTLVITHMVAHNLLSLPFLSAASTFEGLAWGTSPRMGDKVPLDNRVPFDENQMFDMGELVAVHKKETDAWYYTRLTCVTPSFCEPASYDVPLSYDKRFTLARSECRKLKYFPFFSVGFRLPDRLVPQETFRSFMKEISERTPLLFSLPPTWGFGRVVGYEKNAEIDCKDKLRLLSLLERYACQFKERIDFLEHGESFLGLLEECHLPPEGRLCVVGDYHGSLVSALALFEMLQEEGFLDAEGNCSPYHHIVFLGDILDRGPNEIPLLSLLLYLHMKNPHSVHLLRGNHEKAVWMNRMGFEGEFLSSHQEILERCFKNFPLCLCVACSEKYQKGDEKDQYQYVHFSHGFCPVTMDLASSLQGRNGFHMIPKNLDFASVLPGSRRLHEDIYQRMRERFQSEEQAKSPLGYLWNDIGSVSGRSPRGLGYIFSPLDIYDYRQSNETKETKIAYFIRGHQHFFQEVVVERKSGSLKGREKVIGTTLPINMLSPDMGTASHVPQGMILTIRPKARDWIKRSLFIGLDGPQKRPFACVSTDVSTLYERLSVSPLGR